MTDSKSSLLNKDSVCEWLLLTFEKLLEVRFNICALLRDVEVTGDLVRKLPTRLDDGVLETQRGGQTFLTCFALHIQLRRSKSQDSISQKKKRKKNAP